METYFDEWCSKCVHYNEKKTIPPCSLCQIAVKEVTHSKPVMFERSRNSK